MAEWLGSHWEDALIVENCYYREEHHYCETVAALQEVESKYGGDQVRCFKTAAGLQQIVYKHKKENIRARRLIPLGPWCVSWWQRYPAGYRLELEIGEP